VDETDRTAELQTPHLYQAQTAPKAKHTRKDMRTEVTVFLNGIL